MSVLPPGISATSARAAKAATDYAAEFCIPMEEVRDWYRGSDDKPGLVSYMEHCVQVERAWRQQIADEYHIRQRRNLDGGDLCAAA